MTLNITNWAAAAEAVAASGQILLVTHVSPDGDAIGSLLGMANALRQQDKTVQTAVDGGVPDYLQFLPSADAVVAELTTGAWDLMISLDASDEPRTGQTGAYGRANSRAVINLDHHETNTLFGDIHLVRGSAVSATEVVYDWLLELGWQITPKVAIPLLTGLVTDTMGFRTSSVSAHTLGIAQALMQAGASLTEITARTLDSRPFNEVNLWKYALTSVELNDQVISAVITQDDLRSSAVVDVTDSGLVSFLVKVNEAMIAVVFKELRDARVEVSIRSKPGFDVGRIAFQLGGGGHKQASGATIDGPLSAAKARVLALLHDAARSGMLEIR